MNQPQPCNSFATLRPNQPQQAQKVRNTPQRPKMVVNGYFVAQVLKKGPCIPTKGHGLAYSVVRDTKKVPA